MVVSSNPIIVEWHIRVRSVPIKGRHQLGNIFEPKVQHSQKTFRIHLIKIIPINNVTLLSNES